MNGIAGRDVELATIPIGTGMDFVRTYGIPTAFDEAVQVALDGRPRTIDAGLVRYRTWGGDDAERWFANVGSVGMSGAVAQRANGMSKALGGKATFFYALTRVFLEWENTEVTVRLDDAERRGRMHDVIVANGVWHGGGMMLAPAAQPDDGLFDVVLIGDVSKVDFLTTAPKIYKGKHVHHPKVEVLRSASVEVDAAEHLPIEVEGEQVGTTPAVVRGRAGRPARARAYSFVAVLVGRSAVLSCLAARPCSAAAVFGGGALGTLELRHALLELRDLLLHRLEPAHALREVVDPVLHLHRALQHAVRGRGTAMPCRTFPRPARSAGRSCSSSSGPFSVGAYD